ncbi:hypothetical protein GALMADRAFT_217452 [Galerina marginata CBS 339.88]|uniref:Uncharacterized protein n=1 Tax=Galerina marginata (strain CBS 339.88) TaxID=685588 RepID=A0A067SFW1_GALM3|nr:hypothetical protein GALMADRAFT_217452 [Galerina marginata CBS 339.88]
MDVWDEVVEGRAQILSYLIEYAKYKAEDLTFEERRRILSKELMYDERPALKALAKYLHYHRGRDIEGVSSSPILVPAAFARRQFTTFALTCFISFSFTTHTFDFEMRFRFFYRPGELSSTRAKDQRESAAEEFVLAIWKDEQRITQSYGDEDWTVVIYNGTPHPSPGTSRPYHTTAHSFRGEGDNLQHVFALHLNHDSTLQTWRATGHYFREADLELVYKEKSSQTFGTYAWKKPFKFLGRTPFKIGHTKYDRSYLLFSQQKRDYITTIGSVQNDGIDALPPPRETRETNKDFSKSDRINVGSGGNTKQGITCK